MSTNIATLGNDKSNIGATAIDNTTNRYFYAIFELVLAAVDLSAQANPAVSLYLVPSYDGTNYADDGTDDSTTLYPPQQYQVAAMGVDPGAGSIAHRAVSPHILIDPVKYTPVIVNKTGAAFVSANTLKAKYYTVTTA
jgi:hypothetical protein